MVERLLGFVKFRMDGDAANPAAWDLLVEYPVAGRAAAARLDRGDARDGLPNDVLSRIVQDGVGEWNGTRHVCGAIPICESLGFRLRERAAGDEVAVDAALANVVTDEIMDEFSATLEPLAAIRPASRDGLPAPDSLVFADSRPTLTAAGGLMYDAMARALQVYGGNPMDGTGDEADHGTITTVKHYLGLRARDFDFMERATAEYVRGDHRVDTTNAGVTAHGIERAMWERGITQEPRLLDERVVRLLEDAELLDASTVLMVFDRLPMIEPDKPLGPNRYALTNASGEILRVLGPVDDKTAAIVKLCAMTDHVRAEIITQAVMTQRETLLRHNDDRIACQNDYVRRLRALEARADRARKSTTRI